MSEDAAGMSRDSANLSRDSGDVSLESTNPRRDSTTLGRTSESVSRDPANLSGDAENISRDAETPCLPAIWEEPPRADGARRAVDARRYARLLVSDIRLYHEEDVILGRACSDIRERLEEAISGARAVYLRRFDDERIFDSEVLRILAGGDPRKLG